MNANQYKNVVQNTLNSSDAQTTADSMSAVRAVCNNLGVAFPNGTSTEVQETLNTGEYMGWEPCTEEEAQQRANNGTPVLGMTDETVTMILPENTDEEMGENVVSEYASTTSGLSGASRSSMQYYSYSLPTTTTTVPVDVPVESLEIDVFRLILIVGQTETLTATVNPANATNSNLQWTIDDPNIASIDLYSGNVIALNPGNAIITATATDGSGANDICQIIVPPLVESVTFTQSSITIGVGDTISLNTVLTPSDISYPVLEWESQYENVATVEHGCVTGRAGGTTIITARAIDTMGKYAECEVTVDDRPKATIHTSRYDDYFTITFEETEDTEEVVWYSVGCDLSNAEDSHPEESTVRMNDNLLQEFNAKQLAYLYSFDPDAVIYYVNNYYLHHNKSGVDLLYFKDEIYKEIFGQAPRKFFIVDGRMAYGQFPSDRNQYYTYAEVFFGELHVTFDLSDFIEQFLLDIFASLPGVSQVITGLELCKELFFTQSFAGVANDYVSGCWDDYVSDSLTIRGNKIRNWSLFFLNQIDNLLNAFSAPDLNEIYIYEYDVTICDNIKNGYYRTVVNSGGSNKTIEDIIERCQSLLND